MVDLIKKIASLPLFHDFSPEDLRQLSSIVIELYVKKGQTIFSEGDEANGFYMLYSGRIKIYKLSLEGKEQILHIIYPGEPFGEVPVFDGNPFPAHAKSIEKSDILYFPRNAFIDLISQRPPLALKMLSVLSKRLKAFTTLIEDLSLKEVPGRLANYIIYLNDIQKVKSNKIILDMTKNQLASLLGTIPETLSRILTKMKKEKIIALENTGCIRILDQMALEQLANGEIRLSKNL